jgi:hypothetical protein
VGETIDIASAQAMGHSRQDQVIGRSLSPTTARTTLAQHPTGDSPQRGYVSAFSVLQRLRLRLALPGPFGNEESRLRLRGSDGRSSPG